jgi:tRNA threonylcarbamoyladenosine biosynthesis protein TsaB
MLVLCIRTDQSTAEIYLYLNNKKIAEYKWQAHRRLADTLLKEIDNLLKSVNKELSDLEKIAIYKGPGSFTGLRIGISVANALGYSLDVPVVAHGGEDWITTSLLSNTKIFMPISPTYGKDPHITIPKK